MAKIAIIIRTKNEEVWISSCINSILNQTIKDYQIIIVDNQSTDLTLKIVENFPVKVVQYAPLNGIYRPGAALNTGIRAYEADYYAFISAHCIAKSEYWLEEYVNEMKSNARYAGIYGRQEPLAYSSAQTKRDLSIAFGSDPRTQQTDPFFHNGNSIIRKEALLPSLFDEAISNIEDREWARQKISEGWLIRYSASSSVYHYHGIHHDNNPGRLKTTALALENLNLKGKKTNPSISIFSLAFIISIRINELFEGRIAKCSIKAFAEGIKEVSKITKGISLYIVSSKEQFEVISMYLSQANITDIETYHIQRDLGLDNKWVSILDVLQFAVGEITKTNKYLSHLCYLDLHYLFRNPKDMKLAVRKAKESYTQSKNLTVLFGEEIPNNKYLFKSNELHDILSESFRPKSTKTNDDTRWRIHSGYLTLFTLEDIKSSALFSNEIELASPEGNLSTIRVENNTELEYIFSKLDA